MCFSASASFGASAILGLIGVAAIKKGKGRSQHLFAAIPLMFSIQQFAEGLLWLSLTNSYYAALQQISIYIFLLFAYVVWPVWIPLTIMLLEKNAKRKKVLQVLLATGTFISLYIAYCLCWYPVHVSVNNHHIRYTFEFPHVIAGLNWVSDAFYFIATIPAPFISTLNGIWIFGIIITGSYIVSRIFFKDEVISVWCYFAAALSIVILLIIRGLRKSNPATRSIAS